MENLRCFESHLPTHFDKKNDGDVNIW